MFQQEFSAKVSIEIEGSHIYSKAFAKFGYQLLRIIASNAEVTKQLGLITDHLKRYNISLVQPHSNVLIEGIDSHRRLLSRIPRLCLRSLLKAPDAFTRNHGYVYGKQSPSNGPRYRSDDATGSPEYIRRP